MIPKVNRVIDFLKEDLWEIRRKDLPRSKSFAVRALRVIMLTIRGLTDGRWQLRASSLTYYSMLSIVPALAFIFGIAKGFGFQKTLEKELYENFQGQEEAVTKVVEFAQRLLENVQGGLMAVIGLAVLFWAIFRVLYQIEDAFNEVWSVNRPRPYNRRITDYLALMIILPFGLLFSSTSTVFITSQIDSIVQRIELLGAISPLILTLLKLLPFIALWLLFTYLYIFMPNTKVNLVSSILAGVIAGTGFQLFQKIYIASQIGISRYNAIYGSFAALPLFIFWLHFSWLIILLGAEISCAHQNVDTYEFEHERQKPSHSFKRLLSLYIVHLLVRNFSEGQRNLTPAGIARRLEAPSSLVNQVLFELNEAGVVSEVKMDEDGLMIYQPALDPDRITIKYVIDALEENGRSDFYLASSEDLEGLIKELENLNEEVNRSPSNKKLKDI